MALFKALPVLLAPGLTAANLSFFALKAEADEMVLLGVPEIEFDIEGARVEVNHGSFVPVVWPGTPGVTPPPVIDFTLSFPDDGDTTDLDGDPDGYRVATNTSGDFVALLFDGPLIGGGAERVTIRISEFVYLTGSIYFEKGPVIDAPLVGGVLGDAQAVLEALGIPDAGAYIGTSNKQLQLLTIGALDVHAFVGLNGPYWVDANGNGQIDRDVNGDIVDAETNPDAIGLVIDDLDFGLLIGTPVIALDPIRYIALKASSNLVTLVGIDGLTAQVDDIEVALNISSPAIGGLPVLPVIDFSALPGGFYGVKTGARDANGDDVTVDLDMDSALVRAKAGYIELDIFGVVTVTGSIAFELGPQATVTLDDGSTKTLTTMTIGAANVAAFVGLNGPYWTDTDRDGVVDSGETSSSAVGIHITDLDLGVFVGLDALSGSAYVAAKLSIHSFGAVNIPGLTFTGTLSVDLNLGADFLGGSAAAIDFIASFPDTDGQGTDDAAGFEVDTGDAANPVLVDFTGFLVDIQLAGTLSIADVFRVVGAFRLQVDSAGLKVFAAGSLEIGPDIGAANKLLDIQALGVLILNSSGAAGDLDIDFALGTDDIGFSVSARVIFNTTGVDQSIVIPDRLLAVVQASGDDLADVLLARLTACGADRCYTVRGGAPRIFSAPGVPDLQSVRILLGQATGTVTYQPNGAYIVAILAGEFNFLGFASGQGVAAVSIRSGAIEMLAELSFTIGPLSFEAEGALGIYPDGIALHVSVSIDVDLLSVIELNASGTLDIDTTASNNYFRLQLDGSVTILFVIKIEGHIVVEVDNGAWRVDIPQPGLSVSLFGGLITISAYGYFDSNGFFDLTLTGSLNLAWEGNGVTGTVTIRVALNTQDRINVGGTLYDFVFTAGGSFSATLLGVELFGVAAEVSVKGNMGETVPINLTVTGTGTFFEVITEIVRMTVDAAETAGYAILNFLGTIGCEIASWFGACDEWVEVERTHIAETIKSISFTIPLGTITLPGALAPSTPPPPKLASQLDGSTWVNGTTTGVLYLNVGPRSLHRNQTPDVTAEGYVISHVSGSAGGETIIISGLGVTETFQGVIAIIGDFGTDNDTFSVLAGVLVGVTVEGGSGNDSLNYFGSGTALLFGDDDTDATLTGNDTLTVGGGAAAASVLRGGPGNDTLINDTSRNIALHGENGHDILKGGSGNDTTLDGGDGNDNIEGRGGTDAAVGGAGNDTFRELLANLTAGETFDGGSNSGGRDVVEIVGGAGADDLRVTREGTGQVRVSSFVGGISNAHVVATNVESIDLSGAQGADTFSVDGQLGLETVTGISMNLGSDTAADTVSITLRNTADTVSLGSNTISGVTSLTANWKLGTTPSSARVSFSLVGADPADNDRLAIHALGGDDFLSGAAVAVNPFAEITLSGGDGNDTLVGTITGDRLDGGLGNDRMTGLGGTDIFLDAGGIDFLDEVDPTATGDIDFGIYGNWLVIGTAGLLGTGESQTLSSFSLATIEGVDGIFETVRLIGGSGRNHFFAGAAGSVITANGLVVAVTARSGAVEFHGLAGDDVYVAELNGLAGATVRILEEDDIIDADGDGQGDATEPATSTPPFYTDTDGDGHRDVLVTFLAGGTDLVVVRGTAGADTGGAALAALSMIGTAGVPMPMPGSGTDISFGPTHVVTYSKLEANEVYLLDGADAFTVTDANVLARIDAGNASDRVSVLDTHAVLEIHGGAADDRIDVQRINAATSVFAESGADTFVVGTGAVAAVGPGYVNSGLLDDIDAALTLDGGSGTSDAAHLDDAGESTGEAGTLTSTTFTGLGMGGSIAYANLDSLTVNAGSGPDDLLVESTHVGSTAINANAGADRIAVRTTTGITTVTAGDDSDTVNVGKPLVAGGFVGERGRERGRDPGEARDRGLGPDVGERRAERRRVG